MRTNFPFLAALLCAACAADAAQVQQVSPQGEAAQVAEVRQVSVRFDSSVVGAGDPRATAPFSLLCNGSAPAGDARWLNDKQWVFDLREPLGSGQRCTLKPNPAFKPIAGALTGPSEFSFSTGAPIVLSTQPYSGARIEADQHFLLRLNGVPDAQSVRNAAYCEVDGLGERMPVRVIEGAVREDLLRQLKRSRDDARTLLLACQRPLPADTKMRLVWGAGVAAAGQPQPVSKRAQRFAFQVRANLLAEFSCERENAQSPCLPLRPMSLRFNAPVQRAQALAVRLVPAQGKPIEASVDKDEAGPFVQEVRFAAPLPENTGFKLTLPAQLQDEAGRALANAGAFPLDVATGGMPPLAKFSGAAFGVLEAGVSPQEPALLPITLRQVQADLAGASTSGQVRVKRLDGTSSDATLLQWLSKIHQDQQAQFKTRSQPMLAAEADATRAALPQLQSAEARATEVIGIPLPQRGYHVVEVESRVLGHALLAQKAPMYARTGALVTNLAVHFKNGRSSSLVWVTTLDRAQPVAGARVAVNDCNGKPLWSGTTDTQGIARIERGFESDNERCLSNEGLFVTARSALDLAFVFSGWQRGIEPWRFNIPTASGTGNEYRAHTVFDRTLLRVGETVSMKHFVREETEKGLALPAADTLPGEVLITHVGSDTVTRLPLPWPRGARSSESRWTIPKTAPLGLYDVALVRGEQRLASGSLRVEAFRVPLVDARLAGPSGVLVAPAELAFAAQVNAMAGGPMVNAPLKLSALLRRVSPQFAGYEEFNFDPPGSARDEEENSSDGSQLVADKLSASTDKAGAARLVVNKLPPLTAPSELQAELSFNDPNGEVQTVSQRLRLWPAAVVVGLRLPGWAAAKDELAFTAVVLATDGKPLAGRAVEVVAVQHQTLSTRKRIVGGFYAYDNRRESKDLGVLCSGSTDAQGRLSCTAKPSVSGEIELQARAKDDSGRTSVAAASAWVSSGERWWFAQDNNDRIDLLPEKHEVQPGETARLQLRMPFASATVLLSVEREGVIDARVLTLSGKQPLIELPIPKAQAQSWAPNVIVSALVLRGRLREAPWWSFFTWGWKDPGDWWRAFRYEGKEWRAPSSMVDLSKPSFKLGVAQLQVGRADHELEVKVSTPQPQYKVRDTVKATVQVRYAGKPLAGTEIAFAAVDEGLLALQNNRSWDLLGGLLQARPWGVQTATAQNEVIGRRHYGRKTLPPGGGGGRNPTRELFDTLLLWHGTVVLDANGQAVIAVPLNDSLTRFRLVAIADDGLQRFGSGSTSVRVTQDLQMLSGIAPLARSGDRLDAGYTLRNTTARAMNVKATLMGLVDGKPLSPTPDAQTVQLAAGAAQEVRWTVQVPEAAARIDWEGAAEETGVANPVRDRIKTAQVVLPAVPSRIWQASLQALEGSVSLPLSPPADALPGSAQVAVVLAPKLSGALPGLRRWFETYRYTCLEQMSSRAIGLRDAAAWARLQEQVQGYLDSDGLAHYFPSSAGSAATGSDKLTAHLLSSAHEAGWRWPAPAQEAMLQGLAAFVEGRIERRFFAPRADLEVRKLAALEALARHGRVQPRWLGSVQWTPAAWPTSALLDAWSLYRRQAQLPEREARLGELQNLIRSRLVAGGTTLKFSTEDSDNWWWLMEGGDANAARLLLAATESPQWKDDVPLILSGSLARQKRGAWLTTTANLWGVLALEKFAARFESTPVAGSTVVQLGASTQTQDWAAKPDGQTITLPANAPMLELRHQGTGKPWLTVQTLAAVPLKAPLFAGYRINKTVTPVERKQPGVWSRGDIVRVRLEIDALADMAWVVVDDPIPAGATLLGSGLGRDSAIATQGEQREGRAGLAYEERGADSWRGYHDWMPRGRQVLEYTLRLSSSGRFSLPPTRVEAMYAPESFGELPNAAWEVKP
jgi:alpha-2-macroglobulin